ncbi:hypothetical protein [Modestobacter sp. SSW1-42]|uniref:hypothetical protein n=1 Tax=Modestobacter sp. SSW1-42 TaxID=596372 RepID=UPI0039871050
MRVKETRSADVVPLDELPEWVVNVYVMPPPELMPPVPPMDPAFGFPEALWVGVRNDAAAAKARRAWLAQHAPHVTSRQLWQRRRDLRTAR